MSDTSSKDGIYVGVVESREPEASSLKTVTVDYEGKSVELKVDKDVSLLDQLLAQKVEPDYSCKAGICMACMAQIEEGCVFQASSGPLSEQHIKEKKALLCQARPASRNIKIRRVT